VLPHRQHNSSYLAPVSAEAFFEAKAHEELRAAVARIEAKSSVELVVAVRKSSDVYRDADWLSGAAFGFVVLLLLLFLPQPFRVTWMPLDVLIGFVIGAGATAFAPPLKRLFVTASRMNAAVERAAVVDFVASRVSETRGRTGGLVYVSILERSVRVVWDAGARRVQDAQGYDLALEALQSSVARLDRDAFVRSLLAIGKICQKTLPRVASDVNELPDEVVS
jgi:putative membrane protein